MSYLVLFLVIFIGVAMYVYIQITTNKILNTPPINNPGCFIAAKNTTREPNVIVNIGDSITHGMLSHNYSDIVQAESTKYGYATVNAGMNADLAYSVVQRIDDIIACQPKIVTLLIGSNDVLSTFGNRIENYWSYKRIPHGQDTSLEFYLENLAIIIARLKTIPHVKIYIYSLPVLGEDLASIYNQKIMVYSEAIKAMAAAEKICYLPLNETMREYLTEHPSAGALEFDKAQMASTLAIIGNRYFNQNWDQIAKRNNLQLTCETVHLNKKGAKMVADLLLEKIMPMLCADVS